MIEAEVKGQTGIGDDVDFQDTGDRKIQKGEFIQEHNIIKLVKIDRDMKKEECKFVSLNWKAEV
jgi:hypothetical protein